MDNRRNAVIHVTGVDDSEEDSKNCDDAGTSTARRSAGTDDNDFRDDPAADAAPGEVATILMAGVNA